MSDAAQVEFRRFRTWEHADPGHPASPAWRIVARYSFLRLIGGWVGILLLSLLAIYAVTRLGAASYVSASGEPATYSSWNLELTSYWGPLAAIILLVAAPMFAEDLRFHAPLFYFSRPIRPIDYWTGKVAALGALVAAAVLVPAVVAVLLQLVIGVPSATLPQYGGTQQAFLAQEWRNRHIDTVAEWGVATLATLPAFLILTVLLMSVAVLCSVYTRRGWHAGMAFLVAIAGLGMLSTVPSDGSPYFHLLGPIGWAYLMMELPMRLAFDPRYADPDPGSFAAPLVAGAPVLIPLAYLLAVATLVACLWLSYRRVKATGADL